MAILRRNCPHCYTERVAFEITWAANQPHGARHIWNCIGVCGACGNPVCFLLASKNPQQHQSPTAYNADIEPHFIIAHMWPERVTSSAPAHTPAAVAKRFLEGEDGFNRRNWNSAVAMYRSALDIATKGMEGVPPNQTFFKRLEWLHETHAITPEIRSWADHVRVEGNAALHDPDEFDEKDAKALRFFTEMFLRYVFELPGAVKQFRAKVDPAAGAPA